ncbi:MAG TPA: TonB-dependent receptor [Steroidobacteraceae bacterium]|nr:TonB-dependent receptor [Steroidobacteraceae bacterium]
MLTCKKVSAGSLLTILPMALTAQTPRQDAESIQEIIVTATKRESSLQDVPFSIAAVTEGQIRNSGATDIAELARNIPGLTITDLGPGQSQVSIRGISAGQVVRDQPGVKEQVGVYLDESPISIALFTPDLDLFDLQRFEILRGPQGTLFGAGSLAGTLRYITVQPQLGTFGGTAELNASGGTGTDFGGSAKGALNVPFGDVAAMRIVGFYDELAGFIDATQPNLSVRKNVDSGSKSGGRLAFLIRPNESLSITPRVVYQKLNTDGFPRIDFYNILANPFTTTQPAVDLGERGQFTQLTEGLDDDFTLTDLKLEYDFGPVTLTSISSYTDRKVVVTRDATSLTGSVTFDIGGTADEVRISSPLIDTTKLHAFSQEVRLASPTGEKRFQWVAGAFFQDLGRRYGQRLPTPGYDAITRRLANTDSAANGAPPDNPFFSSLHYDFQQFAVFGEGTYSFTDQWDLTLGVRYYDFKEDRTLTFGGFFAVPQANVPGSVDSDGFTPRAILTYRPHESLSFSAQVSRGFRLGGINDPLNAPICSPDDRVLFGSVFSSTWKDEKAWDYELGMKSRFADGRVVFNASAYYSDIQDLQANVDAGSCSSRIVVNVPKAHSLGIEAELFARPSERWDFGLSGTWVEARIDSTVTGAGTTPIAGIRDGNRLPTAPEVQGAGSVTYSWPWFAGTHGYANFTVQYVGSSYTQLADQEPPFGTLDGPPAPAFITYGDPTITSFTFPTKLPSYDIGNFRVGVRSGQWEGSLFVNNVWDERAFLSLDRERGSRARVGFLTNRPRTYGATFHINF